MSTESDLADGVYGGSGDAAFPKGPDTLVGVGAVEDSNSVVLVTESFASLLCGNTAIRFSLRSATGLAAQVAVTDRILGANQRFDWLVTGDTKVAYVEAADAASAYQAWVWSSSTK